MPILKARATVLLTLTLYKPQHRMAKIVTMLAFVGTLGVAMEASAQTVNHRLGTPPFARDGLTMETAPTLYDAPDCQRPVGFEPQDKGAWTVSTSWQPLSPVLVVAEGAALRRQTGRPTLPNWRRNSKIPSPTLSACRFRITGISASVPRMPCATPSTSSQSSRCH